MANIKGLTQYMNGSLDDKDWDKNDHVKFWIDFDHLTLGLKHEVNKLALLVDVNDKNVFQSTLKLQLLII